ncbi:hypothetical protein NDR87_22845 [Nocardia sp. CDC159]|uniref:Uncharacterized protein n=1 Tax=Nocardia pulmonis TaxID=2951408 RepID=A0A9X2EEG0_9NOCA|nr:MULTISPECIES: hypothetical protein [Nocardia]MCM6776641.1 hypothetical protein [Nocardia pulmonis]MCM6789210.1 hypothetical protein [Nocardia sp. CDC159]
MTDFVDRLLGRATGAAIRPMIPTLFEPLARRRAGEPLVLGTVTDTAHGENSGGAAEPICPPAAQSHPIRILQAREPRPTVGALPPERQPSSAVPVAAPEPVTQSRSGEPPVTVPVVEPPMPSEPAHRSATSVVAHTKLVHRQSVPVYEPAAVPPASPSRRATASRAGRPPEPEVRISIGRVEIRAAAPAAEPTRRTDPPKRPRLSLDDYLRGRDGGVRS